MKGSKTSLQQVDIQQYRIWQGLYLAFYSPRFYVDVMKRWRGLGLRYLLLLMLCVTLPFSVRIGIIFNQYLTEQIIKPLEALPPFSIHQGKISFKHFMPYSITNSRGQVVAIVDTTGSVETIDHTQYPQLSWLFTSNTMEFKAPPLELVSGFSVPVKENNFKEILDDSTEGVFIGKDLVKSYWMDLLVKILVITIFLGMICFFFSLFGFLFLGFAWLIQFYARVIFQERVTYSEAYRLLVVSLTAPSAILFFLLAIDIVIPQGGLFYLILFSIYFSLGLLAFRKANRQLVVI